MKKCYLSRAHNRFLAPYPYLTSRLTAGCWSIVTCSWKKRRILTTNHITWSMPTEFDKPTYWIVLQATHQHTVQPWYGGSVDSASAISRPEQDKQIWNFDLYKCYCLHSTWNQAYQYIANQVWPHSENSRQWNKSRRIHASFWNTDKNDSKQLSKTENQKLQQKFPVEVCVRWKCDKSAVTQEFVYSFLGRLILSQLETMRFSM